MVFLFFLGLMTIRFSTIFSCCFFLAGMIISNYLDSHTIEIEDRDVPYIVA